MNIKLKNIYLCDELSEQGTAFHADLYVAGAQVGIVENKGKGEVTSYRALNDQDRKLIQEAESWCESRPPIVCKDIVLDGVPLTIPLTLELFINDLLSEHLKKTEDGKLYRRMERDMADGIVFGTPGTGYGKLAFKVPLSALLREESGIIALKMFIHQKVLPVLRADEVVLNTNISPTVLEKLAIPPQKLSAGLAPSENKRRNGAFKTVDPSATGRKKRGKRTP